MSARLINYIPQRGRNFAIYYLLLVFITSFFIEINNTILARIINQIPLYYLLILLFFGVNRKLTFVEKLYVIILVLPTIKHSIIYEMGSAFIQYQNVLDLLFTFIAHAIFLIIFRREGSFSFTNKDLNFWRIGLPLGIVFFLFCIQLIDHIPDNFFGAYSIFILLIVLLTISCDLRKISPSLKIIGNIGLFFVLFCTYFALYSRLIHNFQHNYIIYRNSYYVGIALLLYSSYYNIEDKFNKKMNKSGYFD